MKDKETKGRRLVRGTIEGAILGTLIGLGFGVVTALETGAAVAAGESAECCPPE